MLKAASVAQKPLDMTMQGEEKNHLAIGSVEIEGLMKANQSSEPCTCDSSK